MDGRGSQEPHGVETVIPAWFPPVNNGGHIPIQGLPFFWTKAQTQCQQKSSLSLSIYLFSIQQIFNKHLLLAGTGAGAGNRAASQTRTRIALVRCVIDEVAHCSLWDWGQNREGLEWFRSEVSLGQIFIVIFLSLGQNGTLVLPATLILATSAWISIYRLPVLRGKTFCLAFL